MTRLNTKLPLYVSQIPEEQAQAVDARNILCENLIAYAFPPISTPPKSSPKTDVSKLQAHPNHHRLADKTMVLLPGRTVNQPTTTDTTNALSAETTTEQPIPQQPRIPEPPCVGFRTPLQNQGFCTDVVDRLAVPQRLFTRAIYASK